MESKVSSKYLYPRYANSNCGSLRSYDSIFLPSVSSSVSSSDGEVHINAAYDSSGSGDVVLSSNHDYEDLQDVRKECKEFPAPGPRRKDNDLYEPTGPLKHRVRQITECSDDFSAASVCSGLPPWKKDSCLSKLILGLILTFSVAALVLVILIIYGTVGPKCGCKDFNTENKQETPTMDKQFSVQGLLKRIGDLEKDMSAMKEKMEARDNAVKMFVEKHGSQVKVLQVQVNKTANKVVTVDGVLVNMSSTHDSFRKKLDSEFKQLNKSVKELNNKDSQLTSQVSELRQHQKLTIGMSKRLAINVSQVASRVQALKTSNSNISSRAVSLEKRFTQMNNLMKTLQVIDSSHNASQQQLQTMHKRLRESLTVVNATLNDKIKNLDSSSNKPGAIFSLCEHKVKNGTRTSATDKDGESLAIYTEKLGQRVMGATCSTDKARFYKLEEPLKGTFRCRCLFSSPVYGSGTTMYCSIHVWVCPI